MNPLAEPEAVALLLQHQNGYVHVFCDGSSRWSTERPNPTHYWDPGDVPETIPCQRRSYSQARVAFSTALKKLRNRGVNVG